VHEAPTTLTPVVGLRSAADQPVNRTRERADEVTAPRPFLPVSAPLPSASSFPTTAPTPPAQPTEAIPPVRDPVVDGDVSAIPELATLAKSRRAITTLVWVRERRGQRLIAVLRADGLIELPSGDVFADPDKAASSAVGAENLVDGWRAWRLGEGGPTLAEATGILRP
jgi:hypothetical protein